MVVAVRRFECGLRQAERRRRDAEARDRARRRLVDVATAGHAAEQLPRGDPRVRRDAEAEAAEGFRDQRAEKAQLAHA